MINFFYTLVILNQDYKNGVFNRTINTLFPQLKISNQKEQIFLKNKAKLIYCYLLYFHDLFQSFVHIYKHHLIDFCISTRIYKFKICKQKYSSIKFALFFTMNYLKCNQSLFQIWLVLCTFTKSDKSNAKFTGLNLHAIIVQTVVVYSVSAFVYPLLFLGTVNIEILCYLQNKLINLKNFQQASSQLQLFTKFLLLLF
eukprot:TRINITY_DN13673_c0_g1_i1.p1 TRINITY_DN13673_c0_g1~~TRINITY_DN13673_c0_g1_i1.p1  ORF type:complete len:198 (+),score=-16.88 TRINITY_DN13673_c0_g1_i1:547-1140(+)